MDEPVDGDINLTQDQVQRLTDLYNYPPDPDSMSPFWINNGCWDTNITDLAKLDRRIYQKLANT